MRHFVTIAVLSIFTLLFSHGYVMAQETASPENTAEKIKTTETLNLSTPVVSSYAYLGVAVDQETGALPHSPETLDVIGLRVLYVAPDSPADLAGIQAGDILIRLNQQLLLHKNQLRSLMFRMKPLETVSLQFIRDSKPHTLDIVLAKQLRLKVKCALPPKQPASATLQYSPKDKSNALRLIDKDSKLLYSGPVPANEKEWQAFPQQYAAQVREALKKITLPNESAAESNDSSYLLACNFGPALTGEHRKKCLETLSTINKPCTVTDEESLFMVQTPQCFLFKDAQFSILGTLHPAPQMSVYDAKNKLIYKGSIPLLSQDWKDIPAPVKERYVEHVHPRVLAEKNKKQQNKPTQASTNSKESLGDKSTDK